jgi:hypothetical protein
MAKDADNLADRLGSENTGGMWSWFLAEEDEFDRRALWRLGSWAVGSVGAVIIALVANQSSIGWRHEQIASADLARQSQQIQTIAKENLSEARRLASAIDTLNGDRDRLYARVGVLEQGLDSVTGALARQKTVAALPQAATAPQAAAGTATPAAPAAASAEVQKQPPAPAIAPVATTTPAPAAAPPPMAAAPTTAATAEKPPAVSAVTEPSPATVSSVTKQAPSNPSATTTSAAPAPALPTPAPLMASKSMMGPPDPATGKLIESSAPPKTEPKTEFRTEPKTASTPPTPEVVASASASTSTSAPSAADETPAATESQPKLSVQRTEFGVDVGGANSVGGLRALWRGLLKSRANAPLAALRPIIVIKENSTGLGMQLRLVAGPLTDAAAAAKICAGMQATERPCETTVFEGQRLTLSGNDSPAPTNTTTTTTASRTYGHRHSAPKHAAKDEPPPPKPEPSTMSLIFGTR